MADEAQISSTSIDSRFNYEPLFFKHPQREKIPISFLGKSLDYPIWISSMTGGITKAKLISQNLAQLCGKYKLGMGLGSCRSIIESNERLLSENLLKDLCMLILELHNSRKSLLYQHLIHYIGW